MTLFFYLFFEMKEEEDDDDEGEKAKYTIVLKVFPFNSIDFLCLK